MVLENPFFKKLLIFVERHIPMFCLFEHGLAARDSAAGVYKVGRVERCSAFFALVAVSVGIATVRAGAHNIAVGKKLMSLLVVILLGSFFYKNAFVVEGFENFLRGFGVHVATCARIYVETNSKIFKSLFVEFVIFVDNCLGSSTLFTGAHSDSHTVFVASANVNNIASTLTLVSYVNI